LHANNWVTLVQDTELDSILDTPLQTAVNILLPWDLLEVGLGFGEIEGVDTTVKVGIL